jgi:hypothetical protein
MCSNRYRWSAQPHLSPLKSISASHTQKRLKLNNCWILHLNSATFLIHAKRLCIYLVTDLNSASGEGTFVFVVTPLLPLSATAHRSLITVYCSTCICVMITEASPVEFARLTIPFSCLLPDGQHRRPKERGGADAGEQGRACQDQGATWLRQRVAVPQTIVSPICLRLGRTAQARLLGH